ncbi:MAG: hypothetical protein ACOH12_09615 [Parvibaculaceae bacterium]
MRFFPALMAMLLASTAAQAGELGLRGSITPEIRYFPQSPSNTRQDSTDLSIAGEATGKYFFGDNDSQSIVVTPFARWDQRDHRRTHFDLREARYGIVMGSWELRAGFDKVFWGVTEAVHLVDIINQVDVIEDPVKQEVRLGQPMVRLRTTQDFGTFDVFVLPYFRERTYPSADGRPATDIPVDTHLTRYESSRKERHVDGAARYSNSLGDVDFGLSYFQGTGRDPVLQPAISSSGDLVLSPLYPQIKQASFDAQATKGAWLYKAEGYWRDELNAQYEAITGGIEYTFYGAIGSGGDLGLVAEYALDSRGLVARAPYEDDGFVALRWTANDEASTTLLGGAVIDAKTGALGFRLKGERRMSDDYLVSVEAYGFADVPQRDPVYNIADDGYVQFRIARFF